VSVTPWHVKMSAPQTLPPNSPSSGLGFGIFLYQFAKMQSGGLKRLAQRNLVQFMRQRLEEERDSLRKLQAPEIERKKLSIVSNWGI
jgi:hypothetical protein